MKTSELRGLMKLFKAEINTVSSSVIDLVRAAIYFSPHFGALRSHQSFLELLGSASATLVVEVFVLLLHVS